MTRREFIKATTVLAGMAAIGALPKKQELAIIHRWDKRTEQFIQCRMADLRPGDVFTTENADGLYRAEIHACAQHYLPPLSDGSPVMGVVAKRLEMS